MTYAVDWLMSKFGTNFARNSKFNIRMTISCQLRDSVTPALMWSSERKFLYLNLHIQNSKCNDKVIEILIRHMFAKFHRFWLTNVLHKYVHDNPVG